MYKILNFNILGNHDGNLIALEGGKSFPFNIKRVYYIFNNRKDVVRGKHAHRKLEQVIVCISGSCDFILDDGKKREKIHLDTPNKGLYIKHNIWREFTNFSKDCIIIVFASEYYDEKDYIRDYQIFLNEINSGKQR